MGIKSKIRNLVRQIRRKAYIPIPKPINTQKLLDGKVAMITGGSGGIGFAIAQSFVKSGCRVILCGTNEQKLKNCCEKLQNNDVVRWLVLDVTDIASLDEKVVKGGGYLGILISWLTLPESEQK